MAKTKTMTSLRRVAIIQARTSSSRFPGKVLEDLGGMPMIVFMAKRAMRANLHKLIVATSNAPSDDHLAETLSKHRIECFRGSLEDVLDRFYQAACLARADIAIRLTGDCPLIDADIIDALAHKLESEGLDYASNCHPPTYPDGLDVEAVHMDALTRAWREAALTSEREHVTPYLKRSEKNFRIGNIESPVDLSHLRWTVDHMEDLLHVRNLFARTGASNPCGFDRFDLLRAVDESPSAENSHFKRNEGYAKSLEDDSIFEKLPPPRQAATSPKKSPQFKQTSHFMHGEGDQWFLRNQKQLGATSEIRERIADQVALHLPSHLTSAVLEIGCANGANLAALSSRRKIKASGIDPSLAAVREGMRTHPEFHLSVGAAHSIPFPDLSFDLIWFGFCLYLLDRELLMRTAAEADRCLKDGGAMIISDFDTNLPVSRNYKHLEGVHSYKMDYSRLFLGNPAYVLAEKHSFSHSDWEWNADPQERVGLWILKKTPASAYHPL